MTDAATLDAYAHEAYGRLAEPATLTLQRRLTGPIERVFDYLARSELRRQWLAAGDMTLQAGAPFTFVWRNDDLTVPPGRRPDDAPVEHRMDSRIIECAPPHRLTVSWGAEGEVAFALERAGDEVLLTLTHRRIPDRTTLLSVSSGWHAHLDVLGARLSGGTPEPFWDAVLRLKAEYARRLPA